MYKIPDDPKCEGGNDLIAFLYGELDEGAARDFERHLINCADCESELSAFKQIRSSAVAWRRETVGAATATSAAASPVVSRASDLAKPSAMTAFRQFFDLSPWWMKGSMAFASVLFCLVSALALAHLFENPKAVVAGDEQRYTEKELQAKIEDALKSSLQDRETQKPTPLPSVAVINNQRLKPQRRGPNRSSERVGVNPMVGRGPLTKSEREQLAADLRLILLQDETDFDLLSDGINQ
jgi:hypothetical protein